MRNVKKLIPFQTETEESSFWDEHSLDEFWESLEPVQLEVDPLLGERVLKRAQRAIPLSVRLPKSAIEALQALSREEKRAVSFYVRKWVCEGLRAYTQQRQ